MTDQKALDEAKQRYLAAKHDVERLRLKIALDTCPLKVGEIVEIDDEGKRYLGKIDLISDAPSDFLEPMIGVGTPWTATGQRFKKGTSDLSTWTFSVTSHDELKNGVWHKSVRTIEEILNLK